MLLLALLTVTPEHASYLFLLEGTPVGAVELERQGDHFRYTSTHWMHAGAAEPVRRETASLPLGKGHPLPEALWLWHRPVPGSVELLDELTGKRGTGAARVGSGTELKGEVLGAAFEATYDRASKLETLHVGPATFLRVPGPPAARTPPDLLQGSFPIEGDRGRFTLQPPEPALPLQPLPFLDETEAQRLAVRVHAQLAARKGAPAECAEFARAYVRASGGHAEVVRGLYAAPGAPRAQAHAWVRVFTSSGPLELDPTLESSVTRVTHLELRDAGTSYLRLFEGQARLIRRE